MKKKFSIKFFTFLLIIFSLQNEVFALQETPSIAKTYEQYQQNAKNLCDSSSLSWGKNNSLVPVPQYPKLESEAVNNQINSPNLENLSLSEKQKLQSELNMQRLGSFDGFKTLEVARLQYRSTMNSVFSCSIIDSRLRILEDLRENFTKINSEINAQLDKEKNRLASKRDEMNCNLMGPEIATTVEQLVNSATKQYCHYRHYLSYLEENLRNDKTAIERMEKSVGFDDKSEVSGNSEAWIRNYNKYTNSLSNEINRADTTLPTAIKAYKDMERAYPVHLMLAIIYDDFIRLRKNLATYMNASTQTYLKALNAQDTNKR